MKDIQKEITKILTQLSGKTFNSPKQVNEFFELALWRIARIKDGEWREYEKEKPKIGKLVLIYRDINEDKQIYVETWSEENERYAELNNITHWKPIAYPRPYKQKGVLK